MKLDGVRKRPGMYVGDTADGSGLHNMVYEVVSNSINEALAGQCDRIEVVLNDDGTVTVRDNGRGIPFDLHPEYRIPAAELIMTHLHAGGKFFRNGLLERRSDGVGIGLAVVNVLSESLCLHVWRNGLEHTMRFHSGTPDMRPVPAFPVETKGETPKRGTEITFLPDRTIFAVTAFDFASIEHRLQEFSGLNSGATIALADKRRGQEKEAAFWV